MGLIFMGEGALGAVASVFHGGEFFGAGPGDGEQEGGVVYCFDVVTDGGAEGEEIAGVEVVGLPCDGDADVAFEDLDGDGAVGVVLLHVGAVSMEMRTILRSCFLKRVLAVVAGLPGFFLLGVGDLLGKVELRHFVDHGAVLQGGCHVRSLLCRQEVYAS